MPILNGIECSKAWDNNFSLNESQICAGGENGRDSCNGDSGGGLYIQNREDGGSGLWYHIGIVSFGSKVCGDGNPGVYTRIATYLPWIMQQIGN